MEWFLLLWLWCLSVRRSLQRSCSQPRRLPQQFPLPRAPSRPPASPDARFEGIAVLGGFVFCVGILFLIAYYAKGD